MYFVFQTFFGLFAVCLVAANSIPAIARAASYDLSGRVQITKVSDGDSLRSGTLRIRLFGIDAPELKQECKDQKRRNMELWHRRTTPACRLDRDRKRIAM